ncbi:MAG: hypothetical protein ABIJ84_04180 [bacterium]
MKTIEEIFINFYKEHLEKIDEKHQIKKYIDESNYQYVLGYVASKGISLPKNVRDASLYLNFKLLRSRQIGNAGEDLFKSDYEKLGGNNILEKLIRGNQKQLNPDFFEKNKKIYIEVKTATIYKGNKFIFEQIRLKDPRINYYVFLGITPEGRFYWVLNKEEIKPGKLIYGAKFSPQHSTKGSNATYQWHPSFEQMKDYIILPDQLTSEIM